MTLPVKEEELWHQVSVAKNGADTTLVVDGASRTLRSNGDHSIKAALVVATPTLPRLRPTSGFLNALLMFWTFAKYKLNDKIFWIYMSDLYILDIHKY